MDTPPKKRRCLDLDTASPRSPHVRALTLESPSRSPRISSLVTDSPRRSPRIKALVSESPRRSPRIKRSAAVSPKKLSSSRELFLDHNKIARDESSSLSYTNGKADTQTTSATAKKITKNKKWSEGPRLGGRGIHIRNSKGPRRKHSGGRRGAKRAHSLSVEPRHKTAVPPTKTAKKNTPQSKAVDVKEVSIGKVKLAIADGNRASPSKKKFFKSRRERPETLMVKTGFNIKFACDVKQAQKENVSRKKRPLAVTGGQAVSRLQALKEHTMNLEAVIDHDALPGNPELHQEAPINSSYAKKPAKTSRQQQAQVPRDLGSKTPALRQAPQDSRDTPSNGGTPARSVLQNGNCTPSLSMKSRSTGTPRTPKTPQTKEEEMLAAWGFDDNEDDDDSASMSTSVATPSSSNITLAQQQGSSTGIQKIASGNSDSTDPGKAASKNTDKDRLFPIFNNSPPATGTPKNSKSILDVIRKNETPSPGSGKKMSSRQSSPRLGAIKPDKAGKEQYILDAGQKFVGLILCPTCGMSYNPNTQDDVTVHEKFHYKIMKTLHFPGWKTEKVVQEFPDGSRIIVVLGDNKKHMMKVEQIQEIVDEELGFVPRKVNQTNHKAFLFISERKEIVGYCLTEPIQSAFKLVPESPVKSVRSSPRKKPLQCSTKAQPAKCGINRIWVLHSARHSGIATKMLDCARFNFLIGCPLGKDEVACTVPTPDGRALFTKYNGHGEFLVYN